MDELGQLLARAQETHAAIFALASAEAALASIRQSYDHQEQVFVAAQGMRQAETRLQECIQAEKQTMHEMLNKGLTSSDLLRMMKMTAAEGDGDARDDQQSNPSQQLPGSD